MAKIFLILITAFFLANAGDTIKVAPKAPTVKVPTEVKPKAPTVKVPTEVKPKAPTNWSKIKDLFL
jgi:hypothetical protein